MTKRLQFHERREEHLKNYFVSGHRTNDRSESERPCGAADACPLRRDHFMSLRVLSGEKPAFRSHLFYVLTILALALLRAAVEFNGSR